MDFKKYKDFVKKIEIGKHLPGAVYAHKSALKTATPPQLLLFSEKIIDELSVPKKQWNIIKFYKRDHKFSLLYYPDFFEESYPALKKSFTINLQEKSYRMSDFSKSENPPILHRKELFLDPSHPMVPLFQEITKEGENIGLYEHPKTIGFKFSWERLISRKGYSLVEGRLIPKANITPKKNIPPSEPVQIERHLTAINRDTLSAPLKSLARHHYLDGEHTVFDYGCGKGDDVRELEAHGHEIYAWDPVHRPNGKKNKTDIVNLGFVINVIECREERDRTIKDAYKYANKILVVSAMLARESLINNFKPYGDGIITERKTFQKYYSQSELKSYIETTLEKKAIAVSPGIFYVFKDDIEEQLFLLERQQGNKIWKQLSKRERNIPKIKANTPIEKHKVLFDDFWNVSLNLGRIPAIPEFEFSEKIRAVAGSHIKAINLLKAYYGEKEFDNSQERRRNDLLVYFALSLFEGRKPLNHLPESLKRDIKFFWAKPASAFEEAQTLLFSVGKPQNIAAACQEAKNQLDCGLLNRGHSYIIHRQFLNQLSPVLRVYVGCSTFVYGDLEDIDLIKIHMTSSKVSLMSFDDFEKSPLPMLQTRVKIDMRSQNVVFFHSSEKFPAQPLYLKSKYISKEFPNYRKQSNFDSKIQSIDSLDLSGFGPSLGDFKEILSRLRIEVKGFKLGSVRKKPT